MKKSTSSTSHQARYPFPLPPFPPGMMYLPTPLDVYRQSRLRSHAEQRACLPGHGEAMRDATLVRQISPVFLARAQVPFEVDGPHRSHVGRGLINQGLTAHTHTHTRSGSPPRHELPHVQARTHTDGYLLGMRQGWLCVPCVAKPRNRRATDIEGGKLVCMCVFALVSFRTACHWPWSGASHEGEVESCLPRPLSTTFFLPFLDSSPLSCGTFCGQAYRVFP